jgi:hypothetical protein
MNKWAKDVVTWTCGRELRLSVPFTWLLAKAERIAAKHDGPVIAGGPAVDLAGAPWADRTPRETPFDVLSMHNPCATFTSRGCPNNCPFCAVPKTEGAFRELDKWKPAPVVCDNNLLAASKKHFERVIQSLRLFPACDFNQGLEAARFTPWHADQIRGLADPMVRFALDRTDETDTVARAIDVAYRAGLRKFGVYVLVGFRDDMDDARFRLNTVREWQRHYKASAIWPFAMRYQPLSTRVKNAYVGENWTHRDLQRVCRYYNNLRITGAIDFEDFDVVADPGQTQLFEGKGE